MAIISTRAALLVCFATCMLQQVCAASDQLQRQEGISAERGGSGRAGRALTMLASNLSETTAALERRQLLQETPEPAFVKLNSNPDLTFSGTCRPLDLLYKYINEKCLDSGCNTQPETDSCGLGGFHDLSTECTIFFEGSYAGPDVRAILSAGLVEAVSQGQKSERKTYGNNGILCLRFGSGCPRETEVWTGFNQLTITRWLGEPDADLNAAQNGQMTVSLNCESKGSSCEEVTGLLAPLTSIIPGLGPFVSAGISVVQTTCGEGGD